VLAVRKVLETLNICSPKRTSRAQTGWEGFFPYYAGYPETFARALLTSARLGADAVIFDPWNGSGTTTYTASLLGMASRGFDLNPVMVIVARARMLSPSEADSIEPLAKEIIKSIRGGRSSGEDEEPLSWWFGDGTAAVVREIERGIRQRLIGAMTLTPRGTHLERISGMAATFYVALFIVCRELVARFRSSNPTWLRRPKDSEARIGVSREVITDKLLDNLRSMAAALAARADLFSTDQATSDIRLDDTTSMTLAPASTDLVLTSPPYCTRIDYTAATRIELAILAPIVQTPTDDLGRQMIGSTRVPHREISVSPTWGTRCGGFLEALRQHPSKASSGYYYRTHIDYFDKIARSIANMAVALKPNGGAVLVVQDSYYKEIHNDLPSIITDIADACGLELRRREDFRLSRSMSGINPHTRTYNRAPGALEAVLCFQKA
jgi:hypothetical protein